MTTQSATRRRGAALTTAIYRATLDELARAGFADLTFERLAVAAGTGKAALYRRWSNPEELVLAALTDPATGFGESIELPRTGSLRDDLIGLLTRLTALLEEPRGRALRPLIVFREQRPELFASVWESVVKPAQAQLLARLREAAERDEIPASRASEATASVGPRLILMESWLGEAPGPDGIVRMVDDLLLPLLRG